MRKLFETARDFSSDDSGAMFTIAAVSLIGMLGFGGLAVDVGTWYVTKRAMSLAADAAALAAAHQMSDSNSSNGDVETAALIGANKNGFSTANGDDINVTILPDNGGIQVAISRPAQLFFSSLFISDAPVVTSVATAALRAGSMELALILDVSGSMNKPEKIGAARTAAQDLIDILYDSEETLPDTWVAVIPFSGRVNIRDYGEAWMENADTGDADHLCVGLRSVAHMNNDAPHAAELFPDYIEPKKKTTCPDAKALGLTAEKTTVKNHIAALTTTHGTSTHRGMVWGWRALSPAWRNQWGDPVLPLDYNGSVPKVAIIMTDGKNRPEQSDDPHTEEETNQMLAQECEDMKALDITIFSVVFDVNDEDLFQLYADCATPGMAFVAEDAAALFEAFSQIGKSFLKVRLVQ